MGASREHVGSLVPSPSGRLLRRTDEGEVRFHHRSSDKAITGHEPTATARFCAASLVIALEQLHKNGILCRGVSPDVIMLDRTVHLQLVDFRFCKKISNERTFTICGMLDFLAPEIVQGKDRGFPVDWWALGVLIYFMLQCKKPFGLWRESDTRSFSKIAEGNLNLPRTLSPDAVDIIKNLLEVDEGKRLGSRGADSVKAHRWFEGVDWTAIADNSVLVPQEITVRIAQQLGIQPDELLAAQALSSPDVESPSSDEWLEDW